MCTIENSISANNYYCADDNSSNDATPPGSPSAKLWKKMVDKVKQITEEVHFLPYREIHPHLLQPPQNEQGATHSRSGSRCKVSTLQKLNFSLKILVIMWPLPPTFMYAYHSTT
jgi:hypothetical protein